MVSTKRKALLNEEFDKVKDFMKQPRLEATNDSQLYNLPEEMLLQVFQQITADKEHSRCANFRAAALTCRKFYRIVKEPMYQIVWLTGHNLRVCMSEMDYPLLHFLRTLLRYPQVRPLVKNLALCNGQDPIKVFDAFSDIFPHGSLQRRLLVDAAVNGKEELAAICMGEKPPLLRILFSLLPCLSDLIIEGRIENGDPCEFLTLDCTAQIIASSANITVLPANLRFVYSNGGFLSPSETSPPASYLNILRAVEKLSYVVTPSDETEPEQFKNVLWTFKLPYIKHLALTGLNLAQHWVPPNFPVNVSTVESLKINGITTSGTWVTDLIQICKGLKHLCVSYNVDIVHCGKDWLSYSFRGLSSQMASLQSLSIYFTNTGGYWKRERDPSYTTFTRSESLFGFPKLVHVEYPMWLLAAHQEASSPSKQLLRLLTWLPRCVERLTVINDGTLPSADMAICFALIAAQKLHDWPSLERIEIKEHECLRATQHSEARNDGYINQIAALAQSGISLQVPANICNG